MAKKKEKRKQQAHASRPTVSMAVPGSIIDNAQDQFQASFVAAQIARTAAVFNVDEVVVFDDRPGLDPSLVGAGAAFLARVVQFMETPQYLRKSLIQLHPDLSLAGNLPPLDAPHHLRATEWKEFREGVVLKSERGKGSFVDIGLDRTAFVEQVVDPNTRVTLHVGEQATEKFMEDYSETMILGKVVPPSEPRKCLGSYWGYSTRLAQGLSGTVKGCPYPGGYDLVLGTSEHGQVVSSCSLELPQFQHLLVVFGGLDGLETCLANDRNWSTRSLHDVFGLYLNTCPNQGSRTIRTEEAVLISLAFLQPALQRMQPVT